MAKITIDNSNVTVEIKNVSTGENYPLGTIPNGTYNFTISAKTGFKLESVGFFNYGEWESLALDSTFKNATLTNLYVDMNIDFMVTTEVFEEPKQYKISIDDENVSLTCTNVSTSEVININDIGYVPQGVYDMILIANTGYLINSVGFYDSGEWIEFTISQDKKSAVKVNYTMDFDLIMMATTVIEQPEPPPESDGVSGFNHLYLVDKNILTSLSKERFSSVVGGNEIDLGQYIVNVLELPFSIGDSINGLETKITLGSKLVDTKAIELLDDEITLNLGEIFIPSKYKNSYDYLNTNIYLHLPFIKTIELSKDYLINETITIQYIIDLFTGDTSLIIRSTKLGGEIVYNESVKIGKNIPFIKKSGDIQGTLQNNNGLNNQMFTAFIEVIRNKPYELDSRFNDGTTIQTKLLNEKGFVNVNNITLNSNATLKEQDRIISILSNGIYIK